MRSPGSSRHERVRPRVVFALLLVAAAVGLVAFGFARSLAPVARTSSPDLPTPPPPFTATATTAPERVAEPPFVAPAPSTPTASASEPAPVVDAKEPVVPLVSVLPGRLGRRTAKKALLATDCDDPFTTDANGLRQLKPQCLDR